MAIICMEDRHGSVDCTFFGAAYVKCERTLRSKQPLMISGTVERRNEELSIKGTDVSELAENRERMTRKVELLLGLDELNNKNLHALGKLLLECKGNCPLTLHLRIPGKGTALLEGSFPITPSEHFLQELETLFRRHDAVRLS